MMLLIPPPVSRVLIISEKFSDFFETITIILYQKLFLCKNNINYEHPALQEVHWHQY